MWKEKLRQLNSKKRRGAMWKEKLKKRLLLSFVLFLVVLSINSFIVNSLKAETVRKAKGYVVGYVFWDKNNNGLKDPGEPGIPNVCVSNGIEVVQTDSTGFYSLPAYEEMVVFVIKPKGYTPPLNKYNIPQFFYIHRPKGSPPEIQNFPRLEPTGDLPELVNFPLLKSKEPEKFKIVAIGDTQPYTKEEIKYLRYSLIKDMRNNPYNVAFGIVMGDNIGDNLHLYPEYLNTMKELGIPLYYVPGNHDVTTDANESKYAFDSFLKFVGPTYYAFNYGDVHFIVLNDIVFPSPKFKNKKTYHGEISKEQIEWLKNNLKYVPKDRLIVISLHIPIVSYQDRLADKHKVSNREELYEILKDRKVLVLAGHTHTVENHLPGDEYEGWGQPIPFHQIIVGAACGSWWSGDFDKSGIPVSYQRQGAPKGYMLIEFEGNKYKTIYKAIGEPISKQMHLGFWTKSFENWYEKLWKWLNQDPNEREETPPVTLDDLPHPRILTLKDLENAILVANVWNGSKASVVIAQFNDGKPIIMKRNFDIGDPVALRYQAYVLRFNEGFTLWGKKKFGPAPAQPLPAWMHTRSSTHIWTCKVPKDLPLGLNRVVVKTIDMYGNTYEETMIFEVVKPLYIINSEL